MKALQEQVREYYEAQSLPEERMRSMIEVGRSLSSQRLLVRLAGAAALALMLALIWFMAFPRVEVDITQAAIIEIAKNHSKKLDPEFVTGDYQQLQAQLSRIDFSILPSGEYFRQGNDLEGGRYCSVQSELAAQLKLRDRANGESCTLYVAALTPDLAKVKPDTRVVNGVRVQVWKEDGRLFGLARDAAASPPEKK